MEEHDSGRSNIAIDVVFKYLTTLDNKNARYNLLSASLLYAMSFGTWEIVLSFVLLKNILFSPSLLIVIQSIYMSSLGNIVSNVFVLSSTL